MANIEAKEVEDRTAHDYHRADRMGPVRTELIVATYENPRALALSLASVARQASPPDSIAIADDGSGPETAAVVEAFAAPTRRWRCGTSGTRIAASRRTRS